MDGPDSAKFPVIFPVSREFGAETGSQADCIVSHAVGSLWRVYGIPVVSERRFLEWIGKAVPDSLHRTYSVDRIASLSKLSNSTIDELVQFGLLDPRGGLFGFRDLARARQISNLFAHGISLSEILRSVKEIRAWLPEADLSNLRLHPAAHHAIEIEQPGGRTDKRGQFVLPVNAPAPNADALFEQAQAAEDAGDIAEAERLYRVLMNCDPTDAAPPFNPLAPKNLEATWPISIDHAAAGEGLR